MENENNGKPNENIMIFLAIIDRDVAYIIQQVLSNVFMNCKRAEHG